MLIFSRRNNDNKTLLDIAYDFEQLNMMDILFVHGAKLEHYGTENVSKKETKCMYLCVFHYGNCFRQLFCIKQLRTVRSVLWNL